jgi:hypothetical protein
LIPFACSKLRVQHCKQFIFLECLPQGEKMESNSQERGGFKTAAVKSMFPHNLIHLLHKVCVTHCNLSLALKLYK